MRLDQKQTEEATRLAIELYARDQEALHQRLAAEAALSEAEIPPAYLDRAREELAARRLKKRRNQGTLIAFAAMALPVALIVLLIANRPPSAPITESFGSGVESRWTFDVNSNSAATVSFKDGTAKIAVDRFGAESSGPMAGRYWATLRSIDGEKNFRTLRNVQFRVRGTGDLSRVRLRFVNGSRSYVTPPLLVGSDWRTHSVSLDRLDYFRKKKDAETSDGKFDDRIRSEISEMQVQVGSYVNPQRATGTVEIDDLVAK